MNKVIKSALIIVLASIIQYYFLGSLQIKSDLVSSIVTFLSIIFGFYITSLSIFATSRYVSSLYKVGDINNKSNTLMHTLFSNYKFGLITTLVTIIYFIIVQVSIGQSGSGFMYLSERLLIPTIGIMLNIFWYSYKMLNDLIRIILQESKNINPK